MDTINRYVSDGLIEEAINECKRHQYNHMGMLLARNHGISVDYEEVNPVPTGNNVEQFAKQPIRVKIVCNWTSSEELCRVWNKMSQDGKGNWNQIRLTAHDVPMPDYYVVINSPPADFHLDMKKTILFRMEPYMYKFPEIWGVWADPKPICFMYAGFHETKGLVGSAKLGSLNNSEWHLSKTYEELLTQSPIKTETVLSTVLSHRYHDVGHIRRIDFVQYLQDHGMQVDVFGSDKFQGTPREWKSFKGGLPYHCKDAAMFPYKYVFNCENNSVKNYMTEKLIDGILAECLVFYSGCPNAAEHIDPRAYVYLELSNFEEDMKKIQEAMDGGLWEERLPFIREAKKKILNEMQFFPRVEKIIEKNLVKENESF